MEKQIVSFAVRHQFIERTDAFFVVAKSQNYLRARFEFFTSDWNDLQKTAVFTGRNSYTVLLQDDECDVPWEVLTEDGIVKVSVFGGDLVTVSEASMMVHGTGYKDGETPEPPTPSVYNTLLQMTTAASNDASKAKETAESVRKDADEGKLKCVLG